MTVIIRFNVNYSNTVSRLTSNIKMILICDHNGYCMTVRFSIDTYDKNVMLYSL